MLPCADGWLVAIIAFLLVSVVGMLQKRPNLFRFQPCELPPVAQDEGVAMLPTNFESEEVDPCSERQAAISDGSLMDLRQSLSRRQPDPRGRQEVEPEPEPELEHAPLAESFQPRSEPSITLRGPGGEHKLASGDVLGRAQAGAHNPLGLPDTLSRKHARVLHCAEGGWRFEVKASNADRVVGASSGESTTVGDRVYLGKTEGEQLCELEVLALNP